ncbi:uncharacterized protein LOC122509422 isoform X2 [Leptopilina heterotoma]|nr:uncharacterized protein LOC122509422 isoform X2 [Leptopilina heterotoma]
MKIVGSSRSAIVNRSWRDKDIVEITVESEDFDQIYQTSKSLKVYSYHSTYCIPSTTKSPIVVSTTPKKINTKTTNRTTIINSRTPKSTVSKNTTPKIVTTKNTTQKIVTTKNANQKIVTSKSVPQKTTKSATQKVTEKSTSLKTATPKNATSKGVAKKMEISKSVTQKITQKSKTVTQKINKSVTPSRPSQKVQLSKNLTNITNSKNGDKISKSLTPTPTSKDLPKKIVKLEKKDNEKLQNQSPKKEKRNSKRSVNEKYKNQRKRTHNCIQYENFPQIWLDLKNIICNIYSPVSRKCKYCRNRGYLITRPPVDGKQNYRVTTTEAVIFTPINQIFTYPTTLQINHRNWNIHKFFTPKTNENLDDPSRVVSKLKITKNDDCDKMIDCDADQNEVELIYQQWD